MNIPATQDRRTQERYKTARYSAAIQRRGLLGQFKDPQETAVINFNRSGMAICCDSKFDVGDKIKIQLHSPSEQVNGIYAVVRYVYKERNEHCAGVQFVESKDFTTTLSDAAQSVLSSMEQVIKHQLA